MLLVALSIGMFITWQYWKTKYAQLLLEVQSMQQELEAMKESNQKLQKEFGSYRDHMEAEIKHYKAQNGKLTKANEELQGTMNAAKKQHRDEMEQLLAESEKFRTVFSFNIMP